MRILFVTSNRVGDAILSTGLLAHLIAVHPGARITIVCGPAAAGVFERVPGLDAVWAMEKRPRGRHWLDIWARAARRRWSLVVDVRGSALAYVVPTRRRAVLWRGWAKRPVEHKTVELSRVLRLPAPALPVAWIDAADRAMVGRLLPPPGARLVALGPTANWDGKIWPAERFVALATALAARWPDATIFVLAGPGETERALAAPVLDGLARAGIAAIDLAGRLTLAQAAAALERATIFVGNDSGLMHLAAAAGCRTIGLFGPTPSVEYAPSGRRAVAVVSPTARMDGIGVDHVLMAIATLVGGNQDTAIGTTESCAAPIPDKLLPGSAGPAALDSVSLQIAT